MNAHMGSAGVGSSLTQTTTDRERWTWVPVVLGVVSVLAALLCVGIPILWSEYIYPETFLNPYHEAITSAIASGAKPPDWNARFWEASPAPYLIASFVLGNVAMVLASVGLILVQRIGRQSENRVAKCKWVRNLAVLAFVLSLPADVWAFLHFALSGLGSPG